MPHVKSFVWLALFLAVVLLQLPHQVLAAEDRCIAVAEGPRSGLVQPAQFRMAQLRADEVRLTYVGHSTFLIESHKGVRIATDYNDYVRPGAIPEIATMNRAHNTHFSYNPDPAIKHVLKGWNPAGGVNLHDVTMEDVRVRNVPTNIRDWQGGADEFGNSIFIFEMNGLCIAHLGHLHHTLTEKQHAQIGQMDVVLVPVDGSFTLDLPGMIEVLKTLKAPLMVPMHYFSRFTLDRFLEAVKGEFDIAEQPQSTIIVSRSKLPKKPQVLVLPELR